ncbi:helix-turn-helix transcriptional regulator [Priestia koreensis]|uniref:Uncharacterized protein n=1 Tax=Priestia koreensis TaxID=284581 RepID=A0A0M0LHT6_9BACI|nr:WYL domain-containing protein [Priestia koreensis]KOO50447.1 hypothetical protein AMD01_01440 [Priestia koreensis]
MSDIAGKLRLLEIKELLERETDEEHELSTKEIVEKLKYKFGAEYKVDHRAIKRDLEALIQSEFDIIENKGKYGEIFYSHQHRLFEMYELRLLVDAVLSARFITKKESEQLIEKLKHLTSNEQGKSLPTPVYFDKAVKSEYQQIKLDIDHIHQAISKGKAIGFRYGRYNIDKQFTLGRDGTEYGVMPHALIWTNNFYYLIGEFQPEGQIRHYRVDRMREVTVLDRSIKKKDINISTYVNQSFRMFAGEEEWLKIQFSNELINPMLDHFGLDVFIRKVDDDSFELQTKANMSTGLIGWILLWGKHAKVISPEHIVRQVQETIQHMHENYSSAVTKK